MREGTISWLFGCHSIIHSYYVVRAWKILFKRWPKFWELVCILVHDIGIVGKDYLTYEEEKKCHWKRGAKIAHKLFGYAAFFLVMDHDSIGLETHKSWSDELTDWSEYIDDRLFKADKYSYYIAHKTWLKMNCIVELKLKAPGMTITESINDFKKRVKESIDSGKWASNHSFYLERCKDD